MTPDEFHEMTEKLWTTATEAARTSDTPETDAEPNRSQSAHTEASFDTKRRELRVEDELRSIPGATTLMLVAFGTQDIKSIEDLAGCATDDLHGWIENKSGNVTRHAGILERFGVPRSECDAMILHACIKAGWI
jgi:N utilization substance protein A